MRKTTRALLLGIVFSLLLGHGLVGIQPSYAHFRPDCELDRFNAFMSANDQYTSTFRSWYFGQPVSCQQQCGGCNPTDPACASCINSCDNSRYNSFTGAQDTLMAAAWQSCPYNPDECAAARARRDQCVANFNGHLANPVYDGNGDYDITWLNFVFEEYGACRAASGVDNCE